MMFPVPLITFESVTALVWLNASVPPTSIPPIKDQPPDSVRVLKPPVKLSALARVVPSADNPPPIVPVLMTFNPEPVMPTPPAPGPPGAEGCEPPAQAVVHPVPPNAPAMAPLPPTIIPEFVIVTPDPVTLMPAPPPPPLPPRPAKPVPPDPAPPTPP